MGCAQPGSCTRLLLGALTLRCTYSLAAFGGGLACCAPLSTAGEGLLRCWRCCPLLCALKNVARYCFCCGRACTHLPAASPLLPEQRVRLAAALLAAATTRHRLAASAAHHAAAVLERGVRSKVALLEPVSKHAADSVALTDCKVQGKPGVLNNSLAVVARQQSTRAHSSAPHSSSQRGILHCRMWLLPAFAAPQQGTLQYCSLQGLRQHCILQPNRAWLAWPGHCPLTSVYNEAHQRALAPGHRPQRPSNCSFNRQSPLRPCATGSAPQQHHFVPTIQINCQLSALTGRQLY